MNAMIRTAHDPVPAPIDDEFLANMPVMLNLVTDYGDIDLTFKPSGRAGGFDGWNANAIVVEIADGISVRIAALDDIIDSKRTANRPKDVMALPYLESLRDQIAAKVKHKHD